mmetsp:Transcript_46938/g.109746  ORF Transcript_46938/g.109746 Transcript_46938/m.109746 type:complete len:111 (+) Transcript_46938:2541-2873(+)
MPLKGRKTVGFRFAQSATMRFGTVDDCSVLGPHICASGRLVRLTWNTKHEVRQEDVDMEGAHMWRHAKSTARQGGPAEASVKLPGRIENFDSHWQPPKWSKSNRILPGSL